MVGMGADHFATIIIVTETVEVAVSLPSDLIVLVRTRPMFHLGEHLITLPFTEEKVRRLIGITVK
jgi:hypothetical protein